MKCLHTASFLAIIICTFSTCAFGQTARVEGPPGGAIEAGKDAVFTCVVTSNEESPTYTWNDVDPPQLLFISGTPYFGTLPKYVNFKSSPPGDVMNITDADVDYEGQYTCGITGATSDPYVFTVEVGSTLTRTFPANPLRAGTMYTAVCNVDGSRPQLNIAWTIDDIALDVTPNVTNSINTGDPDLSNTRSEVTFTATPAMNEQNLKCATSDHVVTSLNKEATTQLNVTYPPTNETATIVVTTKEENNKLLVTCQVSAAVDGVASANPDINNYDIYAGSEQINNSTTEQNSVLVPIPDNATNYKCIAGNNLGTIESAAVNYDPGQTTTQPTTTDGGLSTGATAGIVVGVLGVTTIVVVVLVVFLVKKKDSGPPPKTMALQEQKPTNGNSEKVAPPTAAPRSSTVPHRNDNPGGAVYAEVQKGGRGYDQPDHTHPPQGDSGMNYATLDLSEEAGHTERQVPQNKDNVVVYSSILV